jgi:putative acyl-CoA dehydrogenase
MSQPSWTGEAEHVQPVNGRTRKPHDDVRNQPPALADLNLFTGDKVLVEALRRNGGKWIEPRAKAVGAIAGGEAMGWGVLANANLPKLKPFDRYGHRIDEVEYDPAWHKLLGTAVQYGIHSLPWVDGREGAHAARAALFYTLTQADAGVGCPLSMTYAAVPVLRDFAPNLAAQWLPKLTAHEYDPELKPVEQKASALCGMAMTEKQGGSDLRQIITIATPVSGLGAGAVFELTGHKWFCSVPVSDAFLTLAQSPGGLSCFFMPRFRPDGSLNRFHLQRLKDKLGNRSNASSEIEFHGAYAILVGEEGQGIKTIMAMVQHTRLDCVTGSAATLRQALTQVLHHVDHRHAFGQRLSDQPLMQAVLADLALEAEAATQSALTLAGWFDRAGRDDHAAAMARIGTAILKYWVCKRLPMAVAELLECCGGNGYVEESLLPRLYREAPLNGLWEGAGNIICLDVLRALTRQPDTVQALIATIEPVARDHAVLEHHFERMASLLRRPDQLAEGQARHLVEQLALGLQAAIMLSHAPGPVAAAFCQARLDPDRGRVFGALPPIGDLKPLIERARLAS